MDTNAPNSILKRTLKIVLLGDSKVGKTSVINRYTSGKFAEKENPTVGVDFVAKNVVKGSLAYRVQLWDTSGNERYRTLIPNYLNDINCVAFVFDYSNPKSLENIEKWVQLFKQNRNQKLPYVLCGNKCDQTVQTIEKLNSSIKFYEKKYKMRLFEVSAATDSNIEEMFNFLIEECSEVKDEGSESSSRRRKKKNDLQVPQPSSENFVIDEMADRGMEVVSEKQKQKLEVSDDNSSQGRRRRKRKAHNLSKSGSETTETLPETETEVKKRDWKRFCCPCIFK